MLETGKGERERERERERETERRGARAPEHAHTARCGVRDKGGKRGHTRTPERARVWARSGVRDEGKGEVDGRVVGGGMKGRGTTQTRRTRPGSHVLRVWVVGGGGKGRGTTQTQRNATLWSRSPCLGGRRWRKYPRHEERDLVVAFFVSGW